MALTPNSLAFSMLLLSLIVFASASGYGYGAPKMEVEKPKTSYGTPKPEVEKLETEDKLFSTTKIIGIQGLIYCKSGAKLTPLQGALARITCLAVDENGYESAPFSILSHPTDAKGYFFATLTSSELEDTIKLTECKAFLENSPLETCKVPSDVNKGISGALLSSYRLLNDKHMKLYSVAPFFYTSEPNPISEGY